MDGMDAHAPDLARTSCSIRSTTSSMLSSVVSISWASGRGLHLRRVALVPQAEVGRERFLSDLGPVGDPAARPLGRVRDEVDLHFGVGADDGADVAALDDGVAMRAELALALPHDLAHLGDGGATEETTRSILGSRISSVTSSPWMKTRSSLEGDGLAAAELTERGPSSKETSFGEREPGQARYMAPVSR
jgi:hypothetical protein